MATAEPAAIPNEFRRGRSAVWQSVVAGLLLFVGAADAQDFPKEKVTILVPSRSHAVMRDLPKAIAARLQAAWGKPVVSSDAQLDFRLNPVYSVMGARPDGYTLLFGSIDEILLAPISKPDDYKEPYDPKQALAPVTLVSRSPLLIVANAKTSYATAADLIAATKARPDVLMYGSTRGTLTDIALDWYMRRMGLRLANIDYRTDWMAATSVAEGHTTAAVLDALSAADPLAKGKINVVQVLAPGDLPVVAGIPPIVDGFDLSFWTGLFAPKGTPDGVISEIARQVSAVVNDGELKSRFARNGLVLHASGPQVLSNLIRNDEQQARRILRETGRSQQKIN